MAYRSIVCTLVAVTLCACGKSPSPSNTTDSVNAQPTKGSIPESLIGTWEGFADGVDRYTFHKDGTYDYSGGMSIEGVAGCSTNFFVVIQGIATVSGQNITLQEVKGITKVDNSCNGSDGEEKGAKLDTETVAWSIEETSSGEVLHLGEFGNLQRK